MTSSFDFNDQVVVITGGASGIGREAVFTFLDAGATVCIADISPVNDELNTKLEKYGEKVLSLKVDVAEESNIQQGLDSVIQRFGKLDAAVHCAGIGIEKDFLDLTAEEWERVISIDLTGTFLFCQAAAKRMVENNYGRIITIASTAGLRGGYGRAAYGAAKGGVITLTKVMAVELARYGITVNGLAPGAIETELVTKMHTSDTRRIYTRAIPAAKYGTPQDTAYAILFLASKEAGYINGHMLPVDGGFLAAGLMKPHTDE